LQYVDKQGKDITTQLKKEGGNEEHYFINASNYKSLNERNELTQLYNSSTNTCYLSVGMELEKIDASVNFPKTFKATFKHKTELILDYECKSLLVASEIGTVTYYYSKKVKVNPTPFSKHRFGNWGNYLKKTKGALPLKFIVESKDYTLTATAVKVQRQKLENAAFDVTKILNKQ